MNNLSNIVGKIVLEAKISVIDELIKVLSEKDLCDDNILEELNNFKESVTTETTKDFKEAAKINKKIAKKKDASPEKKKREPSMFNLYVKNKMPELKAANPDTKNSKMMMSMASDAWKTDPFALYVKENAADMKKENSDDSNVEIFDKLKEAFESSSDSEEKPKKKEKKPVEEKKKEKKKPAEKKSIIVTNDSDDE
jgi:hypothetical protein